MSGKSFVYDAPDNNPKSSITPTKSIVIAMFFDGTRNNKTNVFAREHYEKGVADDKEAKAYEKHGKDASYTNDHSNVDKLWQAMNASNTEVISIYVEGIGTDDLEGDDWLLAPAFGIGDNGIRGKVRDACEKVAEAIDKTVKTVTFDVFGFSRGAAAARNFVYEINRKDGVIELKDVDDQLYAPEGKAPKAGFLGYYLQHNRNFEKEDIEKLRIKTRFVRYRGVL